MSQLNQLRECLEETENLGKKLLELSWGFTSSDDRDRISSYREDLDGLEAFLKSRLHKVEKEALNGPT